MLTYKHYLGKHKISSNLFQRDQTFITTDERIFLDFIINYNEQIIISKLKQYRWDVENSLATAKAMYEDD